MFKFSFPNPNGEASDKGEEESVSSEPTDLSWLSSEQITVLPSHLKHVQSLREEISHMKISNLNLAHISTESAVKSATEATDANSVKLAEEQHSDLIPAKYEGGLKIWECTEDLLDWLLKSQSNSELDGKYVLDLGCGAGLLGIAALKHGANVVFQDYNKEVIDGFTIPNVLLNLTDTECQNLIEGKNENSSICEFYSGDWSSFIDELKRVRNDELKFDYILTSETIYNSDNHKKLCSVFKKCLKPSGCVYLAAKTYYFGVGGGLRQFENVLQDERILKSEVCWKCSSGVSREIIRITFVS